MAHLILRLAGVALLVALTVTIHSFGTMLVLNRQVRLRPVVTRRTSQLLVSLAVIPLVFELLLVHIAQIVVWGLYFYALGIFDGLRTALYFAAVTYTTLGYGDVIAGPMWVLEAGGLAIVGWLMFGWSTGVLVWIIGRYYEQIFPRAADRGTPAGS